MNSTDVSDFFDKKYKSAKRYWRKQPWRYSFDPDLFNDSKLTYNSLKSILLKSEGSLLDVGAGEGTDSIRARKIGKWDIDCIDVSEVACEKIHNFSKTENATVNIYNEDFITFKTQKKYDAILMHGSPHYIGDIITVIEKAKQLLVPGGHLSLSTFSCHTPLPAEHAELNAMLAPKNVVKTLIDNGWEGYGWYEIDKFERSHNDLHPHTHSHAKAMLRNVNSNLESSC